MGVKHRLRVDLTIAVLGHTVALEHRKDGEDVGCIGAPQPGVTTSWRGPAQLEPAVLLDIIEGCFWLL